MAFCLCDKVNRDVVALGTLWYPLCVCFPDVRIFTLELLVSDRDSWEVSGKEMKLHGLIISISGLLSPPKKEYRSQSK